MAKEMGSNETWQETEESLVKELVEGFIHEVKNPLTSIRGALKVLRKKMPPEDPHTKVIDQVFNKVEHINKSLSDMLDVTKISTPEVSLTDIHLVLKQSLRKIRSECQRREIHVEKDLSDNVPKIEIDEKQMNVVFLHLSLDMLQAMPHGGNLVVRSSWDPRGYVLLEFEDTGTTIPEIHLERLFKPFLSTMGRGSKIGLYMTKRILNQNGAMIHAKNRGEEGMTFTIIFPVPFEKVS